MFRLFQSELFRMRRRPQSWLLVVITFLLVGVFYGGFTIGTFFTSGQTQEDLKTSLPFDQVSDFGLAIGLGFFGAVMLIIVASGMMGNEYGWNTLRPLVARASSRASLLTAKLLALAVYTLLFSIVVAILIGAMSIVSSLVAGVDTAFTGDALLDTAGVTLRFVLATLPYLAFAFMLATLARSNVAGIAGSLGLSFIEGTVFGLLAMISETFATIQKGGIAYNQQQVLTDWSGSSENWTAVAILLGYTALFLVVSYWTFLRRDVISG